MGPSAEASEALPGKAEGEEAQETSPLLAQTQTQTHPAVWWKIIPAFASQAFIAGITLAAIPEASLKFFGPNLMTIQGAFTLASGFVSLFVSPAIGVFSDRYGRRKAIAITCILANAQCFPMLFTENMWWYMALSPLATLSETTTAISYAYVADVTPLERRPFIFGLTSASMSFFFILASITAAIFTSTLTMYTIWVIMSALTVISTVYLWFMIPDSVAMGQDESTRKMPENASKKIHFRSPLGSLRQLTQDRTILFLGLATFFFRILITGYEKNVFTFVTQYLDFNALDRSIQMTMAGVFGTCAGLLLKPVSGCVGPKWTVIAGMTSRMIAIGAAGLTNRKEVVIAAMSGHFLGDMVSPMMSAMLSARANSSNQGGVQGAVAGLGSLAGAFAPLLFGAMCNWFADHATYHAGHGLVVGCMFTLPAIVLVMCVPGEQEGDVRYEVVEEVADSHNEIP